MLRMFSKVDGWVIIDYDGYGLWNFLKSFDNHALELYFITEVLLDVLQTGIFIYEHYTILVSILK